MSHSPSTSTSFTPPSFSLPTALYRAPRIMDVTLGPPYINSERRVVQPIVRARILSVEWNAAAGSNLYLLSRLDSSVPGTILAALEEQLVVVEQPTHSLGDRVRLVAGERGMAGSLGLGAREGIGAMAVYKFKGWDGEGEGFTKWEILAVLSIGWVDIEGGYVYEVGSAEWETGAEGEASVVEGALVAW
jgi:hypothetical protein